MPEVMNIGPFMLKWSLLAFLLSTACGFYAMKLRLRREGVSNSKALDVWLNGIVIVVVFWKFGLAVTDPSMIWERPRGIILYNGSALEIGLGMVLALIYILFSLKKRVIKLRLFLDLLPYGTLTMAAIYTLLSFSFSLADILLLLVSIALLLVLWSKKYIPGSGAAFADFMIYYGIGLLLVSLFRRSGTQGFYLSYEQIGFLLMIFGGMIHNKFKKGADPNE